MKQYLHFFSILCLIFLLSACETTGQNQADTQATQISSDETEATETQPSESSSTDDDQSQFDESKSAGNTQAEQDQAFSVDDLMATRVYFDFDRFAVQAQYYGILAAHADYLNKNPEVIVEIHGHADERGGTDYNQALGEKRAESVADELISLGVNENQLLTISFGETRPTAYGDDEVSWSLNRRVEFLYQ